MQFNSEQTRRYMRCGFMPEAERLEGQRWLPDGMSRDEVKVCPGYTTTLPEVIDAIANFHHYEAGCLRDACGGRKPPGVLLEAMAHLKGAIGSKEAYRMREQAKKNKPPGGA